MDFGFIVDIVGLILLVGGALVLLLNGAIILGVICIILGLVILGSTHIRR